MSANRAARNAPLLQRLLPRIALTRLVYRVTRIRIGWIKNLTIRLFVKAFDVDTNDAAQPVPTGYADFNAFFTRALLPDARPLANGAQTWVSPCDGRLSEFGKIESGQVLQTKGIHYSVAAFLDGITETEKFTNGTFATIYLAPWNYHRVHAPAAGKLVAERQTGDDLFSVNAKTVERVPALFVENERRIQLFETPRGQFAVVFVGALNVGSITTVASGEHRAGDALTKLTPASGHHVERGDLLGWFNMGSTVVIIAEPDLLQIDGALQRGQLMRMGERLGQPADG